MKRSTQLLSLAALLLSYAAASAQERVQFPSLGDDGAGPPRDHARWLCLPTCRRERRPAVVFLDGCSGLFSRTSELIETRERAWAIDLNGRGYVDLMVDSFRPRNHGEMCSQSGFDRELYQKRPRDAYAALLYLHAQPYVRSDRIGIIGWSEGGGAVLYAIRTRA